MKEKTGITVDQYIEKQPEPARALLRELRACILKAAPDASETFSYGVPAYTLVAGGKMEQQVMIAGFKNHVGLYPHPTVIEHFAKELSVYKQGKGSVQFPFGKALPCDLIMKMVQYRISLLKEGK